MTGNDFNKKFCDLQSKYNFWFEPNCDLWSLVTGFLFYRNESDVTPMFSISGIEYDRNGKLIGDFDLFIKTLEESLAEEFKF